MNPTAPSWSPQIDSSPDGFWQRPAVRATLRSMYVVAGVGVAAAAFVVVGIFAALFGCFGVESDGLCVDAPWLIPVLEWPIFLVAWLAPLAGGITSYVRREPVWLGIGVTTALVMGYFMTLLASGQTSALS